MKIEIGLRKIRRQILRLEQRDFRLSLLSPSAGRTSRELLLYSLFRVNLASGREILRDVHGIAKPGQLLALMGASGTGKTTLLNVLMARNLKGLDVTGGVQINGVEIGKDISKMSGFAQQEELFVGTLTVRETLWIQALLRIRGSTAERRRRVKHVMEQLNLVACADSRIGVVGLKKGISGGERRRLTFACQMLSNPSLLFADEPTSGLDSFMAENVIQLLSDFAASGRTIICTIHQPSSQIYQMFDAVMYMANGKTAFLGSPQASIEFFEKCGYRLPPKFNPSEFIISVLAVVPGEEEDRRRRFADIVQQFETSDYGRALRRELNDVEEGSVPEALECVRCVLQILALLRRCFMDVLRNPGLARAKIAQKTVMGLFVGLLYLKTEYTPDGIRNINGALFFIVNDLSFSTVFGILHFLNSEFPLIAREYHDGLYHFLSYYVARCTSYMPLFTIDGMLMMLILYWLIGLSASVSQVLWCLAIAALTQQASMACGIAVSAICPSVTLSLATASPLLIVFALVGGFYGNANAPHIKWIQYISWNRFSFEAFMINQWSSIDSAHNGANWTDQKRDAVLAQYQFDASMFYADLAGIAIIAVVLYAVGFVALYVRIRRAR